ncbi:VOC family protein [Gordonia sp. LSe1-13]|uniref:VOC family protein n=1 Tax=Gordonia sesuvii TaxID=3116777 RepID=A0ABU7M797_9ACTN|nr:VOC family protein [Gordonia sp. LSe1-13]
MKLEFFLAPTKDLEASLALYRDGLGWQEAWREGDLTVTLAIPGSEASLMIDAMDPEAAPGPVFSVESLADFHSALPAGLAVVDEPAEIPGGFMATYRDPGGATLYVLDQSTGG